MSTRATQSTRPSHVNIESDETFFIGLLLVLMTWMEVVILLMIHMLEFVF